MGARGPKPACECGSCSACKTRARELRWRRNTPEKQAEYRARRAEYQRAYRQANRERLSAADLARYHSSDENKAKWRARRQLNDAVRAGKLDREPCEVCGASPTEGHHDDYSRPLDVRWLCKQHHAQIHCVTAEAA